MKASNTIAIIISATACFVLSYMLVYVLSGLSTLYFAYDFDVPAVLFFDHLWLAEIPESSRFSNDATSAIFLSQPVCSFLIGIILLFTYRRTKMFNPLVIIFFIYLIIISLCNCFALIIYDFFFVTELSELLSWMGIRFAASLLALFFSVFFLLKIGRSIAIFFLSNTSKNQQKKVLLFCFVIPCLTGNLLVGSVHYASVPILMGIIFLILNALILVSMFFVVVKQQTNTIVLEKITLWKSITFVFVTTVLILITYCCLRNGFSFSEIDAATMMRVS